MLDFTSALYLGLRHPSASLRPWAALTTGRPAALGRAAGRRGGRQQLAALQGCERPSLLPSTLHLFWDLFRRARRRTGSAICVDAGTVPGRALGRRAGRERSASRLRTFAHHDAGGARQAIDRTARCAERRPIGGRRRLLPELRRGRAAGRLPRAGAARTAAGSWSTTPRRSACSGGGRAESIPTASAAADRCAGTMCSDRTSSSAARWPRASVHRSPCFAAAAR